MNPFKNPFQPAPQQQSYQNWTIPESQSPFNGFGSPVNNNGFSNGFYYNHNMTNGIIAQPFGGGKGGFGNPFMVSRQQICFNHEITSINFSMTLSRQPARPAPAIRFYETWKWREFSWKTKKSFSPTPDRIVITFFFYPLTRNTCFQLVPEFSDNFFSATARINHSRWTKNMMKKKEWKSVKCRCFYLLISCTRNVCELGRKDVQTLIHRNNKWPYSFPIYALYLYEQR